MRLQDITTGANLSGIEPAQIVTVVATIPHGYDALQLIYRTPDGAMKERLLGRGDEASISAAAVERPFSFDGDGAAFQLTCEAKRIDLAFLFDPMMAVHTSNVDALPHQITAVYESMLPRQPLRFVLADDPGAGKTIMAGLYISELIMRADARRILVVAPGSLVEQWRDELFEKFGLEFPVYSPLLEQASPSGNPFENHQQLIVRLDQLSRNEELQEKLCAAGWDLAIFDEAHKLAAHYFGTKLDKTARFRFAEKLGAHVRHLLLMGDIEFMSDLLIGLIHGPQGGSAKILDDYYEMYEVYEEEIPGQAKLKHLFDETLLAIRTIFPDISKVDRWSNRADFYSLFVMLGSLLDKLALPRALKPMRTALEKFALDVNKSLENPNVAVGAEAKRYARAIEKGSNDKARRSVRHEILHNLITPYLKKR
jgi:Type III restriction enzyme, res subunit